MAYIDIERSPLKGLKKVNVTSDFGYRKFTYKDPSGKTVIVEGHHSGIDLTPKADVVPIAPGKITGVRKTIRGYDIANPSGNYVTIYHGNNSYSTYCHLDFGSIKVGLGEIVDTNTTIGSTKIKTTGHSTGLHLHFGIKVNGKYVDPKPYLRGQKELVQSDNSSEDINLPINYIIVKNDTLSALAKRYYGNGNKKHYEIIAKANNIKNPNMIKIGRKIVIPALTVVSPKPIEQPKPVEPKPISTTIKEQQFQVGDEVQIIAPGNASSWGRLGTAHGIGWTRKVKRIFVDRPFPYQVGNLNGITGYYKSIALKKV